MNLVSFAGGFGLVNGSMVTPLAGSIVDFLSDPRPVPSGKPIPLATVELLAPIPHPEKVICVGLNYRDHAAETGTPLPAEPPVFAKFANSVIGHRAPIRVPSAARAQVDWEAELGVVIGREARQVSPEDAPEYIGGYMCVNDVSARDLQAATTQWTRGKAIDTFFPCGPWLVTREEIPDPQALHIRCYVNGLAMQDSSTGQMSWGVADLVSFMSQTITLRPGDILATGTPPGVGLARKPPVFLKHGDTVEVEIEKLGRLSNPVLFE